MWNVRNGNNSSDAEKTQLAKKQGFEISLASSSYYEPRPFKWYQPIYLEEMKNDNKETINENTTRQGSISEESSGYL